MVAGAGGGAESYENGANGGNAGFLEGEKGIITIRGAESSSNQLTVPLGGNKNSGGSKGVCILNQGKTCSSNTQGHDGGFGFGGDASDFNYGGGGGSGYFGGGGGTITCAVVTSGAGGSSYVSGKKEFHSFIALKDGTIAETESEIHISGLYFTSINYKEGAKSQYSDNDKVLITQLSDFCSVPNNALMYRISHCFNFGIFIIISL